LRPPFCIPWQVGPEPELELELGPELVLGPEPELERGLVLAWELVLAPVPGPEPELELGRGRHRHLSRHLL